MSAPFAHQMWGFYEHLTSAGLLTVEIVAVQVSFSSLLFKVMETVIEMKKWLVAFCAVGGNWTRPASGPAKRAFDF